MASVHGTENADVIDALDGVTNGNDIIFGHGGDDEIYGLLGNDQISGGEGADQIYGGGGNDYAVYYESPVGVSVNLTSNTGSRGTAEGDTLNSIENLYGSAHDDILTGNNVANALIGDLGSDVLKGAGGADILYGGSNDDILKGGGGADLLDGETGTDVAAYTDSNAAVVVSLATGIGSGGDAEGDQLIDIENLGGSSYGDTLIGDDGANVLEGLDGDDFLDGGTGSDSMFGGGGNDIAVVDSIGDTFDGGDLLDTVRSQSIDLILANYLLVENAIVLGNANLNVTGNDAANSLVGNAGANYIQGLGGNDGILGSSGQDSIEGGTGSDTIYGGDQGDTIDGGAQPDTIYGEHGSDTIYGGSGDDIIDGGVNNDILVGGTGKDRITTGKGYDTIVWNSVGESTFGTNRDVITDFNKGADLLDLQNVFAGTLAFRGNQAFTGNAAEVRYTQIQAGGVIVQVDTTADGTSDMEFIVQVIGNLGSADFLL